MCELKWSQNHEMSRDVSSYEVLYEMMCDVCEVSGICPRAGAGKVFGVVSLESFSKVLREFFSHKCCRSPFRVFIIEGYSCRVGV